MKRTLLLSALLLALLASPALTEPQVVVSYPEGVPRVEIAGSYPQTRYTVWRAPAFVPIYAPITEGGVLCLGSCFALDRDAQPGASYLYRFDLQLPDGSLVSFGPYPVTISATLAARLRARLAPNPGAGAARVELFVGGSGGPLDAEARIFDLQGRTVATLHRGPLARGLTALSWNGRADDGRMLASGVYLLRLRTPIGSTAGLVVRTR